MAVVSVLLSACGESTGSEAGADPPATNTSTSVPTTTTAAAPECGSGGEAGAPGDERTLTTSNGETRTYLLDVPSSYDASTPADVVFNFHGRGSSAAAQYAYANFNDLAERDGVILVTPNAIERGQAVQWSPGTRGSGADFDFVFELQDSIRADFCTGRFFATGMSSGGLMSTALACESENDFEAFGPVTLLFYNDTCDAAPPRPIIDFHGTDDAVVSFESGIGKSILESAAAWAAHNGCDDDPVIESIGEVDRRRWTNCDATTEIYVVSGGGHTWPGAIDVPGLGKVTRDISASEIIWELFFGSD